MAEYLSVSFTHSIPLGTKPKHAALVETIQSLRETLRQLGGKSLGQEPKVRRGRCRCTIHYVFPSTLSLTREEKNLVHTQIRALEHQFATVICPETSRAVMKTIMSGKFVI